MIAGAATLRFPAEIAALGEMDCWLNGFAESHNLPCDMTEELRVCLHELAGNVIMHGGGDCGPRQIELRGQMEGPRAVLEFADDAACFDPTGHASGPVQGTLEDVAIGGLGLHLVRSFTDSLAYRRDGAWNRLTLVRGPR